MGEYMNVPQSAEYREPDAEIGCVNCETVASCLRRLDFAIIDVTLYLNVYPDCAKAAEMLRRLRAERAKVAEKFVEKCGSLTMYDNGKEQCRQPWEYGGCCR